RVFRVLGFLLGRAVALELSGRLRHDHWRRVCDLQEMMNLGYSEDLAYIHDAGYSQTARRAAATLLKLLRKAKVRTDLVVDLGCGSGVLAAAVTRAGYDVLGIDISESMLKMARQRVPKVKFVRASFFDFKLPACVAVTAIGECLNYAFEPHKARVRIQLFRKIYGALLPGGFFLFYFATIDQIAARSWTEGDDWAVLVYPQVNRRRRLLTRQMTIFRATRGLYRRSHEIHVQYLYAADKIAFELTRVGFRVKCLAGYQGERLGRGRAAFLATKS